MCELECMYVSESVFVWVNMYMYEWEFMCVSERVYVWAIIYLYVMSICVS